LKRIALFLILIIVAGVLGIILLREKAIVPPLVGPQEGIKIPQEEIKISPEDLAREYRENPTVADEKYKDRILITVGVITSVGKYEGKTAVILGEPLGYPYYIWCFLRDESELKKVEKGQLVVVRGRNVGQVIYGAAGPFLSEAVTLKDCSFVPLKARELKVEFDNETKTFRIKNFGYHLIVYLKPPKINRAVEVAEIPYYRSNATISAVSAIRTEGMILGLKPEGGEYLFYVQDHEGNILFNKTLIFEGPKLKIMKIEKFKLYWIPKYWRKAECQLVEITAIVKNIGDLSWYGGTDVYVAKEGSTGTRFSAGGILNPGEEGRIEYRGLPYTLTEDEKGGIYRLHLETERETLNVTIEIPPYKEGWYYVEVPPYGG